MSTEIEIIGVGAFVPFEGSDGPRPLDRGAKVKVEDALAKRLVADGVAKLPGAEASGGPITGDYASQKPSDLQAEADRRGLTVEGTGADGNVLKADLVAALEADDAA